MENPEQPTLTYTQLAQLYVYAEAVISSASNAYEMLNQLSEANGTLAHHLYQLLGPKKIDAEARELIYDVADAENDLEVAENDFNQALQTLADYKRLINDLQTLKNLRKKEKNNNPTPGE